MSEIIVQKLQKPTKTLKKNVLSDEQQKYELQGSSFAWSQEEKDVFAEKIATCGINFEKISSFMMHKTAAACLEYYSKHYKSEYSEQAKKCLLTMKQSQEKCKNETTPSMSCITVTSNKNYTRTKKTMEEDIKKPVNQSCHESVARMRFDNLPEGQHVSSMKKNEHATGNVLVDEMNSPSSLGMCSSITNSDQVVCLTISKPDAPELKNLNEDSCSNEEIITGEQEIWTDKEQCRLTQAIEMHGEDLTGISAYVGVKSIQQCKNFLSKCKKDLNIGKKHASSNIISAVGICNKSVSNIDSAIGNIMSYSDVMENVSQPAMNVDHGNGANSLAGRSSAKGTLKTVSLPQSSGQDVANDAIESYQIRSGKENHVVCAASGECNYGAEQNAIEVKETNSNVDDGSKDPSDMRNPRSDSRPCIAVIDTAQLTGNEFVQALIASEAMDIDSKDNDDRVKSKDINYHVHCVASKECSGIQRSCNVATQNGKEEVDTISSREGNDLFNALPMQTSNEATKFYDLSSGSDSVASEITYANTSRAQMDINLNTLLDVAPLDADSPEKNHGEASLSLNEPHQATDSAAMEHDESVVRQQATIDNLGANNVTVNDATHVQKIHESQTTVPEITHQPANQPSIMLFGQVIYPVQSSRINPTSNQGNQAVVRSSYDMPSNNTVVVPARSRGDQVYLPGPSTSRSAPVNLGQQQTVLSNRIGYGSTNGAAAWPVSPGSSALTNMSRQRHLQPVNMTPYRMTRGGAPYHPRPGESSSSRLINFNDFNPGQQWSPSTILDTSALVMGYPYLTDSTQNQAPSGTLTFGINGEGASTSNTW
ncbi:hypothetical protein BS78_06G040500 [Paspalum vaginatum]|nr:hypothetical protein BS78_06G040500 [Paspalum vaginatum]